MLKLKPGVIGNSPPPSDLILPLSGNPLGRVLNLVSSHHLSPAPQFLWLKVTLVGPLRWSPPIYSPLGHQSDPFEPQKPDHVIALFRASTDFPSHLELKRETLSAPPRPKALSLPTPTHLRPLISPLPPHLLHSVMLISLKQPGVLLPWTCALTVHSAWNVLLSASRVNHTITPFSKAF